MLVWVLDAIARADLHPRQRRHLAFPKQLRSQVAGALQSLQLLSDDELCLCWSALGRLQLLDKQTSLLFYRAVNARLTSEPASPRRCLSFSLRNWVRVGEALRDFRYQHPLHMDFVETAVLRFLVHKASDLRRRGMQLTALRALAGMTDLSSRQKHRVTAALLALLPKLSPSEVGTIPQLCSRLALSDELLFSTYMETLQRNLPLLEVGELVNLWRSLFRWKVGAPGMQQFAAPLVHRSMLPAWLPRYQPPAVLNVLRSFGRFDMLQLRDATGEGEALSLEDLHGVLTSGLVVVLRAVTKATQGFDASAVFLAANALGQVARAWSWLGTDGRAADATPLGDLLRCGAGLEEAVLQQLLLLDARAHVGCPLAAIVAPYTVRDLALLALAFARLARRSVDPPPHIATELCRRLRCSEPAFQHAAQADTAENAGGADELDTSTAVLSASSMLLRLSAKERAVASDSNDNAGDLQSQALGCIGAWATDARDRVEMHKAVAAVATVGAAHARALAGGAAEETQLPDAAACHDVASGGPFPCPSDSTAQFVDILYRLVALALQGPEAAGQAGGVAPGPMTLPSATASAELLEPWHLDGLLYALTVRDGLVALSGSGDHEGQGGSLGVARGAVVDELCHRRAALTEHSVRFWLFRIFFEPALIAGSDVPAELCRRLLASEDDGPALQPATAACLRDCAFLLEEMASPRGVGVFPRETAALSMA